MRAVSLLVITVLALLPAQPAQPLNLLRAIPLPHVNGRIDHLAYDASSKRLFVAALGNNTVEVIDTATDAHITSIAGFREPQGIAAAIDARVVAIANGQGEGLQFVDANLQKARTVALGDDSDNVRYDPAAKRLYVGYGEGAIAAVDPAGARKLGEVKLAGHPESLQLERSGPRIFVNVPTAGEIAVIDRAGMTLVTTWPVTVARSNFPMALDEANHRLFVGCRRPAKALVYDTTTGKVTSSFDIVGDTDDLFYDTKRKRLYVIGGEGFLDTFEERSAGAFERTAHTATSAGARTGLFVADLDRLYLAVPHRGAQTAEIRIFEAR